MKGRKLTILLLALALVFLKPTHVKSAQMEDYCMVPPFVMGTSVKPNVLVVMDYSTSMQFPAYLPCNNLIIQNRTANCGLINGSYESDRDYFGYFDVNKYYSPDQSGRLEENNRCSPIVNRVGGQNCISGNLLNFVTTTRIDAIRKILTGGKQTPSRRDRSLISEGSAYTVIIDFGNNRICSFSISANQPDQRELSILGTNCPISGLNNVRDNVRIRIERKVSDDFPIMGILHDFCGGLGSETSSIVAKCKFNMQLMIFGDDRGSGSSIGVLKVGKNASMSQLISNINNIMPFGSSPIGEALWEAYDYYKQNNIHSYAGNSHLLGIGNAEKDPYYDGSGQNSRPVPCRKSFVLLLSGGAWDGNVDPILPAYTMHMQDLRDDLDGKQNVETYVVHAFGELDPTTGPNGRRAMITTAIFGGFADIDNNTWPYPFTNYPSNSRNVTYPLSQCNPNDRWNNLCAEWDTAFGSPKDGLPYNFYKADEPEQLKATIYQALVDILRRASSSAGASIPESKRDVGAMIVQPYFYAELSSGADSAKWVGFLKAFWLDIYQNLREDTNQNKILNLLGSVIDKVFSFIFNPLENKVVAIYKNLDTCTLESTVPMDQVKPVIDFACRLADTDPNNRTIYYNKDGILTSFTTDENGYLKDIFGVNTTDEASCIIRYLRGEDFANDSPCSTYESVKRNRTFDVSDYCVGMQNKKTWKLGDIVYSTPDVAQNTPKNNYHVRYSDFSYYSYVTQAPYTQRYGVLAVSANDGMLHVFRLGHLYETNNPSEPVKVQNSPNDTGTNLLGAEEFAFIPRNALPYLKWYGDPNYCRVPTVDYNVIIRDVDANLPGCVQRGDKCWSTVLIGTMGFGGKEITVNGQTYSSSIFAIDLTQWLNGSGQPRLLWEVTLPDKTLTISTPALARNGTWYVAIGTGPKSLSPQETYVSNPKLYFISLRNGVISSISLPGLTGNAVGMVGGISAVDVNNDMQDDALYFGAFGFSGNNRWSRLYRYSFITGELRLVMDLGNFGAPPIFAQPSFALDDNGNFWIYFGTGKFFTQNDRTFNYTNYIFGIKDPCWNGSCPNTVTNVEVLNPTSVNATVLEVKQVCTCDLTGCSTQNMAVVTDAQANTPTTAQGWAVRLEQGELVYSKATVYSGIVFVTSYRINTNDPCSLGGQSFLYTLHYTSGKVSAQFPILLTSSGSVGSSITIYPAISLGTGVPPIGSAVQIRGGAVVSAPLLGEGRSTLQLNPRLARGGVILWIEK